MFETVVALQIIGIFLIFGLLCYTIVQRPSVAQRNLTVILIFTMIAMLGYLFEMAASTKEEASLAVKVGYLGKPFLLLATFYFVMNYAKIKPPKWLFWVLNLASVLVVVIVFTNDFHHLYYATVNFSEGFAGKNWITSTKGPLYWVYVVMNGGYFVANIAVAIIASKKAKTKRERVEVLYMYGLLAVGISGYAIYLTGITGGYDTTILGLFLDTIIVMMLFWRFRLFDALSLAKDKALEDYSDGLIILDNTDEVIFLNAVAKSLFPNVSEGKKVPLTQEELAISKNLFYKKDKIFRVACRPIEKEGNVYGSTLEFRDVTADVNYTKRLNRAVEARTKEIKDLQREIIYSFANMVEARDQETGDHIKNTSLVVKDIAERLYQNGEFQDILDEELIEMLYEVAPLHDLGKITISDTILLKPGPLTEAERKEMQKHCVIGAELIEKNLSGVEKEEYLRIAKNVALCHHEWFDGSGYPAGLKGSEIPLEARIMAVADVYDALRSKRPYKEPYSAKDSIDIMMKEKGTHFDPIILDAFIDIVVEKENA